ncbi:hypothetical protein SAMN05428988_6218 [Chitinophaga sp. YR573]|uniref:hypothetical protein n=1 Tax=Chitinophaga sp. YR573 TaxID=1881040 RepID=UPI0008BFBC19|nr:hypothetical protein [Chitinophaga sp. YR573]SEW46027.1 hypothetical protein SAMN05428988_6218 [Chitinophaga sp. YR573]
MTTVCLHCGKPIQSQRSTKKYCSDNCKQLAFYKRSGLLLSGATMTETLNDNKPPANVINQPVSKPVNDKSGVSPEQQPAERPYQWVYSRLIEQVAEYVDSGHALLLLQHPEEYWSSYTLSAVKWVSIRLRCLLENLIRLSNLPAVNYQTLRAVLEAFNDIMASRHFRLLPPDYSYTTIIKELAGKLAVLAKQGKRQKTTRFRLTLNRKAELMAARYILAGLVPPARFSELDFKE